MTRKTIISNSNKDAIHYAVTNAFEQGWNPGIDDQNTMIKADKNGFFLESLDGEKIGCASAVCYDESFAFFGFYVVKEAYRGKGYGMPITQKRLDYVGDRCIGLDGVIKNVKMYRKIGFKEAFTTSRYEFSPSKNLQPQSTHVHAYTSNIKSKLMTYDRLCFPAERPDFISAWINSPHSKTYYYSKNNSLLGYIVIRKCHVGYKVGPLFAENTTIAEALLYSSVTHCDNETIFIDVPECNQEATKMIKKLSNTVNFSCVRMYKNGNPNINMERVFGITSFELG